MSTPPTPPAPPHQPSQPHQPGPWGPPPSPPRRGLPAWVIVLIIVGAVVLVGVPVVSVAVAGFGVFKLFNPPDASDTPPKPDFQGFDACSLISPADAERVGARFIGIGPDEVTVVGRVVRTTETGVPIDTCQYGTRPTSAAGVEVAVSPSPVLDEENTGYGDDKRKPIDGLGDEAYQVDGSAGSFRVVVRRGTSQFSIQTRRVFSRDDASEREEHRKAVIEVARKAADGVPAKLTLPAAVATGPCAKLGGEPVATALGGPVAYSRSHVADGFTVCSYASAAGNDTALRLRTDVDETDRELAGIGEEKQIGGRQARISLGTITIVGKSSILEIDRPATGATLREVDAAQLALATAAADALLE